MEQNKRSQYLQEYLQYKENMRFLNYDPEQAQWTLEKIKGFSGVKFVELLKGQQEVITWLDNIVSAIQEGAEDWENECNALQARYDRYEKALKRAQALQQLWLYTSDIKPEHEGEAQALISLANEINEALNGEEEKVKHEYIALGPDLYKRVYYPEGSKDSWVAKYHSDDGAKEAAIEWNKRRDDYNRGIENQKEDKQ